MPCRRRASSTATGGPSRWRWSARRSPTPACARRRRRRRVRGLGGGLRRVPRRRPTLPGRHDGRRLQLELHVEHAAAAIAAGLCDVVVGVYASTPRSRPQPGRRPLRARGMPPGPNPTLEWEMPYGLRHAHGRRTPWPPAATWPSTARRPSSSPRSRSTPRRWAAMNPRARYQDPITVDDVLASPMMRLAAAQARLLPRDRRGRRLRADLGRPGPRPAQAAGLRARRRHRRHPPDDHPDARPDASPAERCRGRRRSRWPASSPTTSTC